MSVEIERATAFTPDPEKEYYALQSEIGRFDTIAHGIKNWSITVTAVLIAAAAYRDLPVLALLAAGASAVFWLTEARWKRYQLIHRERLTRLENDMAAGVPYGGPMISRSFTAILSRETYHPQPTDGRLRRLWRANLGVWKQEAKYARFRNVRRPHDLLIVLSILSAVALWAYEAPASRSDGNPMPADSNPPSTASR